MRIRNDPTSRGLCHSAFGNRHSALSRRGTAEIELLISCPLLIFMVLLSAGLMKIGVARLDSNRQAMFEAYENATIDANPQYTGDPAMPPINGFGPNNPALANRVQDPKVIEQATVLPNRGDTFTATVNASAAMISPAWNYSGYPVGQADQQPEEQWFQNYVNESHTAVQTSLKLSPAWTP